MKYKNKYITHTTETIKYKYLKRQEKKAHTTKAIKSKLQKQIHDTHNRDI